MDFFIKEVHFEALWFEMICSLRLGSVFAMSFKEEKFIAFTQWFFWKFI